VSDTTPQAPLRERLSAQEHARWLGLPETRSSIAAVIAQDGWTCDGMHEPVNEPGECPECDASHAETAMHIAAALAAAVAPVAEVSP
jgi:hypothetical protein